MLLAKVQGFSHNIITESDSIIPITSRLALFYQRGKGNEIQHGQG
jgi:hypothetical protein